VILTNKSHFIYVLNAEGAVDIGIGVRKEARVEEGRSEGIDY
jgi:hypothetical protein